MEAEIITIGDEILIGQIVDTNSSWLGKRLSALGVDIRQITSIRDNRESILQQLADSESRVNLIIITGGLGPTRDDVTKDVLCEFFNTKLVRNEKVLKRIEHFFISREREVLESNCRQADLPLACTILHNLVGTASGMWFEKKGKIFISMPGVPYEMEHLMQEEVMPRLSSHFKLPFIMYHTIMTEGIGESILAEIIRKWKDILAVEQIKIAYLPSPGMVKIRLTAHGEEKNKLTEKVSRKAKELIEFIPTYVFRVNDECPESNIAKLLLEKKLTVSTAESCTGGYLAHLLTSISGSSTYFLGSIVAYSNEIKKNQLSVLEEDLKSHGAVSREVVQQMAVNVRKKIGADFGLATSGIAGPNGGTEEKPVGTVWVSIATANGVYSKRFIFEKNRHRNTQRAAYAAISMLRRYLKGQLKVGLE